MSATTKYHGTPVWIGGRRLVIPSLSVKQFQDHYDALRNPLIGEDKTTVDARFAIYIPIIGLALRRNYPDIGDEWLWSEFDLFSFPLALRATQASAGMEGVVDPGEAIPAAS